MNTPSQIIGFGYHGVPVIPDGIIYRPVEVPGRRYLLVTKPAN